MVIEVLTRLGLMVFKIKKETKARSSPQMAEVILSFPSSFPPMASLDIYCMPPTMIMMTARAAATEIPISNILSRYGPRDWPVEVVGRGVPTAKGW